MQLHGPEINVLKTRIHTPCGSVPHLCHHPLPSEKKNYFVFTKSLNCVYVCVCCTIDRAFFLLLCNPLSG